MTPETCTWPLRHLIKVKGRHELTKKRKWQIHIKDTYKDINKDKYKDKDSDKDKWLTCDIWDTQLWQNYDSWEPEFMTIFVTWQSRVTLDSIRNSRDVFLLDMDILYSTSLIQKSKTFLLYHIGTMLISISILVFLGYWYFHWYCYGYSSLIQKSKTSAAIGPDVKTRGFQSWQWYRHKRYIFCKYLFRSTFL